MILPWAHGLREDVAALLAGYNVVYLSPHLDDVCFSIGAMAQALGRGTVVNIFTRSKYVATPIPGELTVERISNLRREEDEAFARACGLTTIALELEEPSLRGRRPHGPGLDDDLAQLVAPLRRVLRELSEELTVPCALFCPAAIGGHVNHVATLVAVAQMRREIESSYRIFFYEDLFYSASLPKRIAGLMRLGNTVEQGRRALRHYRPLDGDGSTKLDLVRLYPSQHRHPTTVRRFSPALFPLRPPHEAFWEFVPR